ncbi:DUF6036 family nucleotidyltransferase, partial [Acinetobacter baumannii]
KLPKNWRSRATVRRLEVDGREVTVVAPEPNDLLVSKLARLDDKDKDFVEAYHREKTLDTRLVERRIAETDLDPAIAKRAVAYI